jgi:uncharacterized membrane protein YbhN (UPF0104 family)
VRKTLRLLISVALLGWLAWRTPWNQIGQAFQHLRLGLWLAALGTLLLTQVVSALRWRLLARPLGFAHSLGQMTGFYFIGMYFNLILPTSVGGDVVRTWYLDGKSGRAMAAFVSVFVDRLSGLLVLLALACVAAAVCPVDLGKDAWWVRWSVWGTAGCALCGGLALPPLARWSTRFARVARLAEYGRAYKNQVSLIVTTTALSVIVQGANVLVGWLVGRAIGAPVPASYYWIVVPMVSLLTLLPVSLNGMGIREGGMILFLTPLGVNEGTAVSLAFLWFTVSLAAGLCGGAVYLFGWYPRPEVQTDHESIGDHSHQGRAGQSKAAA